MNKILIAYYSRKGNNYVSGKIVNLAIGNTEVIADKIHALTDGMLYEIKTIKSYPEDYTEATAVSKIELRTNARPEINELPVDLGSYITIYLGYPNWWGTMPMAVFTFLESADFSGKTIVPFCTHEGSGLGSSERDIRKLCPHSFVANGIAIVGSTVLNSDDKLKLWLKNLNL